MEKSLATFKIPILKAGRAILLVLACFLFILDFFFASISVSGVLEIKNATEAELSQYPFGTERGFHYLSKEAYKATGTMFSFIFIQSLLFGGFLFISKYRFLSCLVLFSPLVVYAELIFTTME